MDRKAEPLQGKGRKTRGLILALLAATALGVYALTVLRVGRML